MSEYLSKEEIKQWRSSLEKITLEEYAARLGKKIEQAKPTNDLVDIVLKGQPVVSKIENWSSTKVERITSIAERAYEREREISPSPFLAEVLKEDKKNAKKQTPTTETHVKKSKSPKTAEPNVDKTLHKKTTKTVNAELEKNIKKSKITNSKGTTKKELKISFKKALTDREQKVFDYFAQNSNEIVYAKDLANLLDLPRDYVYKYIKNLRSKIEGENLKNADKGGFILSV